MSAASQASLNDLLNCYSSDKRLADFDEKLSNAKNTTDILRVYEQAIPAIESNLWKIIPDDKTISLYQSVFCEQEALINDKLANKADERYKFYIVIPVADRPIHLQQCLSSILTLCKLYQYGGKANHKYKKVAVIVADDSKKVECIKQHEKICQQFNDDELTTEYFGINQQIDQIKKQTKINNNFQQILGHYAKDQNPKDFSHKGAAITRNIAYLRLNEIANTSDEKLIFYFIDSDQEFKIKIAGDDGQKEIYAINYFYHLNEIFSQNKASILTGKVVGDPPVSPAVMAGNFQNDVIDFLQQIANNTPNTSCHFHEHTQTSDDAAYHDMADLFGFKKSTQPYQYSCTLSNTHTHLDCFNDFANKLNRFFDGEHPTRVTYFDYDGSLSNTLPARTIYTGNYAFKPECLKYFISFATLKLRMAGPVLGRIIKSEIDDRFVSANLPMLHKRTTDKTGESEFRPGVKRKQENIDLSDEFERQFFGDVMLFTIENLCQHGYPQQDLEKNTVETVLKTTEQKLHQKYEAKHQQIMAKLEILKSVFYNKECWWNNTADTTQAKKQIQHFIKNIDHNFGADSQGHKLINSEPNQIKRHNEILQAILSYKNDRATWEAILK